MTDDRPSSPTQDDPRHEVEEIEQASKESGPPEPTDSHTDPNASRSLDGISPPPQSHEAEQPPEQTTSESTPATDTDTAAPGQDPSSRAEKTEESSTAGHSPRPQSENSSESHQQQDYPDDSPQPTPIRSDETNSSDADPDSAPVGTSDATPPLDPPPPELTVLDRWWFWIALGLGISAFFGLLHVIT